MGHTADNVFRQRRVRPGDVVYVVTNIGGTVHLISRLDVDQILDQREAERFFGERVWDAADHLIARKPLSRCRYDVTIADDKLIEVEFITAKGTDVLKFDQRNGAEPGTVDRQSLRGVRQITESTAGLFDSLLKQKPWAVVPESIADPSRSWSDSRQLVIDVDGVDDVPNRRGVPTSTLGGAHTLYVERRSDGIERFTLGMLTSDPQSDRLRQEGRLTGSLALRASDGVVRFDPFADSPRFKWSSGADHVHEQSSCRRSRVHIDVEDDQFPPFFLGLVEKFGEISRATADSVDLGRYEHVGLVSIEAPQGVQEALAIRHLAPRESGVGQMGNMDPSSMGNNLSERLGLIIEGDARSGLPTGAHPTVGNGP
jgi:hypothetical protein